MKRPKQMTSIVGLIVLCGVLVIAFGIWSHQPDQTNTSLQQQVLSIASELRAPGDHNSITVANSSLDTAQHMRYEIQQLLLKGKDRQQVIQVMTQEYGSQVLAAPAFLGFGRLVWILPWLLLVVIGSGVIWLIRRGFVPAASQHTDDKSDLSTEELPEAVRDRLKDYL